MGLGKLLRDIRNTTIFADREIAEARRSRHSHSHKHGKSGRKILVDTDSKDGSHFTFDNFNDFDSPTPRIHATFPKLDSRVPVSAGLKAVIDYEHLSKSGTLHTSLSGLRTRALAGSGSDNQRFDAFDNNERAFWRRGTKAQMKQEGFGKREYKLECDDLAQQALKPLREPKPYIYIAPSERDKSERAADFEPIDILRPKVSEIDKRIEALRIEAVKKLRKQSETREYFAKTAAKIGSYNPSPGVLAGNPYNPKQYQARESHVPNLPDRSISPSTLNWAEISEQGLRESRRESAREDRERREEAKSALDNIARLNREIHSSVAPISYDGLTNWQNSLERRYLPDKLEIIAPTPACLPGIKGAAFGPLGRF